MPYYEYRCLKCGHHFEVMQKMSEAPKKKCPECAGRLEKLISHTSFQLKGGGWYADGYAKKSAKPTEGTESKTETKTESKAESKKEAPAKATKAKIK